MKAVFESGEKLFQHRVAESVVQNDRQTLRRWSHTPRGENHGAIQTRSKTNQVVYLENRAPNIRRAAVGRQLHHQLFQKVCDDGGREELPALAQDLTDTQDGSGTHSGMSVV